MVHGGLDGMLGNSNLWPKTWLSCLALENHKNCCSLLLKF